MALYFNTTAGEGVSASVAIHALCPSRTWTKAILAQNRERGGWLPFWIVLYCPTRYDYQQSESSRPVQRVIALSPPQFLDKILKISTEVAGFPSWCQAWGLGRTIGKCRRAARKEISEFVTRSNVHSQELNSNECRHFQGLCVSCIIIFISEGDFS